MATSLKNLSDYHPDEIPNAEDMTFGIVVSEYNSDITFALRDGCIETLKKHNVSDRNISVFHVPGAFELIGGASTVAKKLEPDAVITLGCVIKGETDHDKYINEAVANGIARLNTENLLPVIFGLLTVNNQQQAHDRSGGKHGNKGVECAIAAIKMAHLYREIYGDSYEY